MKYAVHFLEPEQECAVMVSMAMLLSSSEKLKSVWPAADALKDRFDPTDVEVVVVPLHRIGAPAGMSGAEVFVVYMRSARQEAGALAPSNALVVKLQKRPEKLAAEKKAADDWPSDVGDSFARPILLYAVRGYNILVAPFRASVTSIADEHRLKFQLVRDLYRQILDTDTATPPPPPDTVGTCVSQVIAMVTTVHRKAQGDAEGRRRELRYSEAYKWYLRETNVEGKARDALHRLFGTDTQVEAFGRPWPNPVKLVERIVSKHNAFEGSFGPVHGDLHPKNIVFDDTQSPNVIDFGWATNGMHVVVDYLLLDINLRAMTMASQVPESQLLSAAKYLCKDDPRDDVMDTRLTWRLDVIRDAIWASACNNRAVHSEDGGQWLAEYLIPYFLVAYGLLVYLDSAKNQRALLACVLGAAERIERELPVDA